MFENTIIEIKEQECQTDFENDILKTYDAFLISDGELSKDEILFIEGLLKLRESGMITASAQVQKELLKFGIEKADLVCELSPASDMPDEKDIEFNEEMKSALRSAVDGIVGISRFSKFYTDKNALYDHYLSIVSQLGESNFMFQLSDKEIKQAHAYLKRGLRISKTYDPSDRRSNYILGIIVGELSPNGISGARYRLNYHARVYPFYETEVGQEVPTQVKDFGGSYELVRQGNLVPLDISNNDWFLDESIVLKSQYSGRETLLTVSPETKRLLIDATTLLRQELGEKYNPIKITSVFRPVDYNNSIGGSRRSAHTRTIGFDIGYDANRKALSKILEQLDDEGRIILTIESDHFHITVIDPKSIPREEKPDFGINSPQEAGEYIASAIISPNPPEILIKALGKTYWEKYSDFPEKYLSQGAIYGSDRYTVSRDDFLFQLMTDAVESLSDDEKKQLVDVEIDINIFRGSKVSAIREKRIRRVYLNEFGNIKPREFIEDDELVKLREGEGITPELGEFLFHLFVEIIGKGEESFELYGEGVNLEENKDTIIKNMSVMISFVMDMESTFRNNVYNPNSSANGRLQYLTGLRNGMVDIMYYTADRTTSFQTALIDINNVFEENEIPHPVLDGINMVDFFQSAEQKAMNSYLYSPQLFSTNQEIAMFFSELYANMGNDHLYHLFMGAILSGDMNAVKTIYELYHHRDVKSDTLRRINRLEKKYSPGLESTMDASSKDNWKDNWLVSRDLDSSDIGYRVALLQAALRKLGHPVKGVAAGKETRNYGPATTAALIEFQIANGIISSRTSKGAGIFGPKTREKMKELLEATWERDLGDIRPVPRPDNFDEIVKRAKALQGKEHVEGEEGSGSETID